MATIRDRFGSVKEEQLVFMPSTFDRRAHTFLTISVGLEGASDVHGEITGSATIAQTNLLVTGARFASQFIVVGAMKE